MACVIGVDVGSQSVKAVVADGDGRALATASAPCTMRHPAGGWAEQDPAEWTRALTAAGRQARTSAGLGRDDPVAPRAAHRGVYDESYGAYRRLFDGVEGALR